MFTNVLLTTLLAFLLAVNARVLRRDVIVPPILYPTTGTSWVVGQKHNVTWDLSVVPSNFTGKGMIVLGFLDGSDDGSEHLDLAHPLANGFPIIDGRTEIRVPNVPTRKDYILVLFGDSGNASGKFTIKNIGITPPPGSSSTGSTSTSSSATVTTSSTSGSGSSSATQSPTTSGGGPPTDSAPSTPTGSPGESSQPNSSPDGTVALPDADNTNTTVTPSSGTSPTQISPSSPSNTVPVPSTGLNTTTTGNQGNAGFPVASLNVAAVTFSTLCAVFVGYVAL